VKTRFKTLSRREQRAQDEIMGGTKNHQKTQKRHVASAGLPRPGGGPTRKIRKKRNADTRVFCETSTTANESIFPKLEPDKAASKALQRYANNSRAGFGPPAHIVEDTFAAVFQDPSALASARSASPWNTEALPQAMQFLDNDMDMEDVGPAHLQNVEGGHSLTELTGFLQELFPMDTQVSGPAFGLPCEPPSTNNNKLFTDRELMEADVPQPSVGRYGRRSSAVTSSVRAAVRSALKKASKFTWPPRKPLKSIEPGGVNALLKRDASCPARISAEERTPRSLVRSIIANGTMASEGQCNDDRIASSPLPPQRVMLRNGPVRAATVSDMMSQ
jgi:hypothetical protein